MISTWESALGSKEEDEDVELDGTNELEVDRMEGVEGLEIEGGCKSLRTGELVVAFVAFVAFVASVTFVTSAFPPLCLISRLKSIFSC